MRQAILSIVVILTTLSTLFAGSPATTTAEYLKARAGITSPANQWEACVKQAQAFFPNDSKRAAEYAKESYITIMVCSDPVLLAEKQRAENEAMAKAVANATRVVKTTLR